MKFAVIGLCLLGLLAAASASVLVNALRVNPAAATNTNNGAPVDENPEIRVLFATRNVPSMTVVDGSMVVTKTMHRSDAPAGYITDSSEVVGKIIATPMVAGQSFAKNAFADLSHAKQLASVIPAGKRAVTISVTDYAGLQGLINPGSMVDVLVSFKPTDSGSIHRDAQATTLLQNVQVLALDTQTVLAPGKMIDDMAKQTGGSRRITLVVDTKQAKALELAMDQGTLSLTLRNPLDNGESDREIVSVHSLMGDVPPVSRSDAGDLIDKLQAKAEPTTQPATVVQGGSTKPVEAPHWDITFIRGAEVEQLQFPMPKDHHAVAEGTAPQANATPKN